MVFNKITITIHITTHSAHRVVVIVTTVQRVLLLLCVPISETFVVKNEFLLFLAKDIIIWTYSILRLSFFFA